VRRTLASLAAPIENAPTPVRKAVALVASAVLGATMGHAHSLATHPAAGTAISPFWVFALVLLWSVGLALIVVALVRERTPAVPPEEEEEASERDDDEDDRDGHRWLH
jgi:DMSO reductase anchor subunit